MPFHRTILVAVATLFTAAMSSGAIAGCCGWGVSAPAVYSSGGGGGVSMAAAVFVQPVAPMPVVYGGWGGGCGGCGSSFGYAAATYAPASPLYVVNQGPEYGGPGVMVP